MTTDNVNLCAYCGVKPVAPAYRQTCADCLFVCEKCGKETPLESGVSWDEMCDPCGVANHWHSLILAVYGDLEWSLVEELEHHDEPSSHMTEAVEEHAEKLALWGVFSPSQKQFADDLVKEAYRRLGRESEDTE